MNLRSIHGSHANKEAPRSWAPIICRKRRFGRVCKTIVVFKFKDKCVFCNSIICAESLLLYLTGVCCGFRLFFYSSFLVWIVVDCFSGVVLSLGWFRNFFVKIWQIHNFFCLIAPLHLNSSMKLMNSKRCIRHASICIFLEVTITACIIIILSDFPAF